VSTWKGLKPQAAATSNPATGRVRSRQTASQTKQYSILGLLAWRRAPRNKHIEYIPPHERSYYRLYEFANACQTFPGLFQSIDECPSCLHWSPLTPGHCLPHWRRDTSKLDHNDSPRLSRAGGDGSTVDRPYRRAASPQFRASVGTSSSSARLSSVWPGAGAPIPVAHHNPPVAFSASPFTAHGGDMMNNKIRTGPRRVDGAHGCGSNVQLGTVAKYCVFSALAVSILSLSYAYAIASGGLVGMSPSSTLFASHASEHTPDFASGVGLPRITKPNKNCRSLAGPRNSTQVCCRRRSESLEEYCYPSIVVAGAQKAGTTALHSYLLFSPHTRPPSKKELHVFDLDKNFQKFPQSIFRNFKPTQVRYCY
jgi:hypothetical protein